MLTKSNNTENVPALYSDCTSIRGNINDNTSLEKFKEKVLQKKVRDAILNTRPKLTKKELITKLLKQKNEIEKQLSQLMGKLKIARRCMIKRPKNIPCKSFGIKICVICSKQYTANTPYQKFCSASCREIASYDNPKFIGLRFKVLQRDNFTCQYCGKDTSDGVKLHVDHIHPRSLGGKDVITNLITSCFECNIGKSDVLLDQRNLQKIKEKAV